MLAKGTITAALAALILSTGCNDGSTRVVAVDLPPHRVDGVYSVTGNQLVTVYWRANQEDDIDHYKIYRNRSATGTFTLIGTSTGTSYADVDVVNGDTYFYAVAAVDRAGQESAELSIENVFDTPRPEGFGVALTSYRVNAMLSGWDFSAQVRRPWNNADTDIYYDAVVGGPYLVLTGSGASIQDAGYVPLRDVDFAPPSGWSADGIVEAIPGHSYILLTRDGHYAKFAVVSRDENGFVMDWAYQIDPDNPELAKRVP